MNERTAEEKATDLIDWLLEILSLKEIAVESGLSLSTLRRMSLTGKATARTLAKLEPLRVGLIEDEYTPY
jgi:hypothetical protein